MEDLTADHKSTGSLFCFAVILMLLSSCAGQASTKSPLPAETTVPRSTISAPALTATNLPIDTQGKRLSQPGKYDGYSQPLYKESTSTSQYITVRDGTRLAALILRPAQDGQAVSTPLPVIWTHNRYHRENILDWHYPETILEYGYVVVSVDVRGSGASFGTYQGLFSPQETQDAYDITEWLAAQPWSDGNIGMFGRSYMGIAQLMAASLAPPHLKAIFPEMSEFDHYSFIYPGGVFHQDFLRQWGEMVNGLDADGLAVTADVDKTMLQEALKEHADNLDAFDTYSPLPYRDSLSALTGTQPYLVNSPASYLDAIRSSAIPVYHWGGWYDMFPKDALLWYSNLTNPQKIVIGPWSHPQLGSLDLAIEEVRWYDYWLKGIDNGVMSEAPIYYYTLGDGENSGWHSAWDWPLPEEEPINFYFDGTIAASVDSVNDGTLSLTMPAAAAGADEYLVDYSATTGPATRWTAGYDLISPIYPTTLMFNDERGLTYTTSPLETEVEVTGHPVVHLWVTSSAGDGDFFVYLEDIAAGKYSRYVTEGNLRASHRATSTAPYNYLGLPYHRSYAEDVTDLTGQPVELVFDLLPTSYVFAAGHRIRVTITCADKDNALTPQLDPPPTVQLYRDADHASHIVLPIIPNP